MQHEEYLRLVPDADTAVLMIHGICGTPNHFMTLLPLVQLVPDEWSVYALMLPGHGGTAMDFGHSSMQQWRSYAQDIYERLAGCHRRVLIVGHSMGCLFAFRLASRHPDQVSSLFLLGVPLRPWLRLRGISLLLKTGFGKLDPGHPREKAMSIACGVGTTRQFWQYLAWIPRMAELLSEAGKTRKMLKKVSIPCVTIQSKQDEVVSNVSAEILKNIDNMEVTELEASGHFYYAPEDARRICAMFLEHIHRIKESAGR